LEINETSGRWRWTLCRLLELLGSCLELLIFLLWRVPSYRCMGFVASLAIKALGALMGGSDFAERTGMRCGPRARRRAKRGSCCMSYGVAVSHWCGRLSGVLGPKSLFEIARSVTCLQVSAEHQTGESCGNLGGDNEIVPAPSSGKQFWQVARAGSGNLDTVVSGVSA
jgi:hypothetical protein